jgi:hypothetical protein
MMMHIDDNSSRRYFCIGYHAGMLRKFSLDIIFKRHRECNEGEADLSYNQITHRQTPEILDK